MKFNPAASGLAIALICATQAPVAADSMHHARLNVTWISRETWTSPNGKGTTLVKGSYSNTVVLDVSRSYVDFGKELGPSSGSAVVSMSGSGDPSPKWHWDEAYSTSIIDANGQETQRGSATANAGLLDSFLANGKAMGFRLMVAAQLKGRCTASNNLPCMDMANSVQSDGNSPPKVTQSIDVTSGSQQPQQPSGAAAAAAVVAAATGPYLTPFSGGTSRGSPRTGYHFTINKTKEWDNGQVHYNWHVQAEAVITLV